MALIKHLLIKVNKTNYALPLGEVKEVVSNFNISDIPKKRKGIRGLVNIRGQIIKVLDSSMLMCGIDSTVVKNKTCVIIINQGEGPVGLLVDEVLKVGAIDEADCQSTNSKIGTLSPYCKSVLENEDGLIYIFKLESLGSELGEDDEKQHIISA